MKKVFLIIAYWVAAIVLTTLLLVSLNYDWVQAAAMSLTFLPSAMALSFFLPKVDRSKNRKGRILDNIYIILGVMTIAFLLIFCIQTVFIFLKGYDYTTEWSIPSMLLNPIFVAGILAVLAYGNYLLVKRLEELFPSTRPITFTSDYRKVSLKQEDILYVESRDSEVWIVARDGRTYRNKMGITQWENLLGAGFIRIHRAFLVNVAESVLSSPDVVDVAGKELPVSRKYKDSVRIVLSIPQDGDGPSLSFPPVNGFF